MSVLLGDQHASPNLASLLQLPGGMAMVKGCAPSERTQRRYRERRINRIRKRDEQRRRVRIAIPYKLIKNMYRGGKKPRAKVNYEIAPKANYCIPLNGYGRDYDNGTMGLFTTQSLVRFSQDGERTISRFRLEVYTAAASAVSAHCKPKMYSLAIAKEPTPSLPMICSDQMARAISISL